MHAIAIASEVSKQVGDQPISSPSATFAIPSENFTYGVRPSPLGVVSTTVSLHSGPLPASDEFQAYEAAYPGTAAWILAEATKSADHGRAMERDGMRVAARDAFLFRLLPFSVVALFLIVFTFAMFMNVWVGAAGLGVTLTSVIVAYFRSFALERTSQTAEQIGPRQQVPTHAPPAPHERGRP